MVSPFATVADAGEIDIAVTAEAVTFKFALLEVMPFWVAVMVLLPTAKVEAMPLALSVATLPLLEAHVTDPETLPVLPSA